MAAEVSVVAFDVVEQILIRLDVEDLMRFKSVCKPWYYLISSPRFVKAHLKRSYENDRENPELGHRRIQMNMGYDDFLLNRNFLHVVGSSNGLVCVSHRDAELFVTNPLTRELKILQTPPFIVETGFQVRERICWGFGFDSSTDDYKVIAGFGEQEHRMLFYVLTLKSNVWRLIGEVKYRCVVGAKGMLCGGALHWFMSDATKRVIMSIDLCTEEFKEIPQPTDGEYEYYKQLGEYVFIRLPALGVFEECLCIQAQRFSALHAKKWIMKNNKWERHDDHIESKYDIAHDLTLFNSQISVFMVYGCLAVGDIIVQVYLSRASCLPIPTMDKRGG